MPDGPREKPGAIMLTSLGGNSEPRSATVLWHELAPLHRFDIRFLEVVAKVLDSGEQIPRNIALARCG
jgi:hypothetical protein